MTKKRHDATADQLDDPRFMSPDELRDAHMRSASSNVLLKGVKIKIDTVSMCQMLARALRDLLARYCDPHLQRLTF